MCNGSCEDFSTFKFHVKKDGVKIGIEMVFVLLSCFKPKLKCGRMRMGVGTNLHKCILVQLGPTVNPSNDDSRLVCETFSFRRNVHHTPFCSAAVPLIRFFNFTTPIYCYEEERRGERDSVI